MSEPRGLRDLNRLRWVTIVLPIVFVWGFELVRFLVLDPNLTSDESHVAAAMVLGGAIVLFAMLVSVYLDRAQRQLVSQNRDLTVTHAVSSAVRGGLSLPDLLEQSLDRVVTETGALAGIVSVDGADDQSLTIRRPATLAPGLAWLGPVLDEAMDPAVDAPRYTHPVRDRHGRHGPPAHPRHPAHRPPPPRLPPARGARHLATRPSRTSRARSPAPPSWA